MSCNDRWLQTQRVQILRNSILTHELPKYLLYYALHLGNKYAALKKFTNYCYHSVFNTVVSPSQSHCNPIITTAHISVTVIIAVKENICDIIYEIRQSAEKKSPIFLIKKYATYSQWSNYICHLEQKFRLHYLLCYLTYRNSDWTQSLNRCHYLDKI